MDHDNVQKLLETNLKTPEEERANINKALRAINVDPDDDFITKARLVEILTTRGSNPMSEKEIEKLADDAGVDAEGKVSIESESASE